MNTAPIVPAELATTEDGLPFSTQYQDIYHPRAGALVQARHVFLSGNDLPARWQERDRFVVLETGFGLGNNFLATWQRWREDPQRCERLVFISIEQRPLRRDDLVSVHRNSDLPRDLIDALQRAWPPLTPNLHRLSFDEGQVLLLLALGDVQAWLPELVASVDAFYLDGFAPAANPRMWDERVCKALGRLAAPDATLATWSAASALRAGLTSAGFAVRLGQGVGGKRDITLARFAPPFVPRRAVSRTRAGHAAERHALIVGGGIAGCAAAWALAEQGWSSTLVERHAQVASEASGNPAAMFHGIVNAHDGVHARFNRAAALAARDAVQIALDRHGVPGRVQGLLRLEFELAQPQMQAMLDRLGMPPDYVQAVDARDASSHAGIGLAHPAWFYPSGGWVRPAGLARSFLERAAGRVELRSAVDVHALHRSGSGWQLLDAQLRLVDEAQTVVLANAADAMRLLGRPDWPVRTLRGQISVLADPPPNLPMPRIPLAGAGYLLPRVDGRAIFGATSHPADDDATVRRGDHLANLAQLQQLIGSRVDLNVDHLQGRIGWRFGADDRLPMIGPVPDPAPQSVRIDQPRFVPRLPGLFVCTALGSRGITWSALAAQVLASSVTGAPMPVEASLLDAIDPARFISRRARRGGGA